MSERKEKWVQKNKLVASCKRINRVLSSIDAGDHIWLHNDSVKECSRETYIEKNMPLGQ